MKTKKKWLITILIILVLLIMGGLFLYQRYLRPEGLREVIESQLEKRLDQRVSIGDASLNLLKGVSITLTDVNVGTPDEIYLKADTAIIKFSIWQLLFGNHQIASLKLIRPEATLRWDTISLSERKGGMILPSIDIEMGSIKTFYKDYELNLSDVNAYVSKKMISIDGNLFGASLRLNARYIKKAWSTELAIKELMLEDIMPELSGSLDLFIKANLSDNNNTARLTSKISDLKIAYPGRIVSIDHMLFGLKAEGDTDHLELHDISLMTPILEIGGKASLYGIKDIDKAILDLEVASKEFDYEEVVSCLPAESFPERVRLLLCEQIRKGRSRFTSIKYNGRLMDLKDRNAFLKGLYIVEELYSQTFSAGYSEDRVTDITGNIIFDGENIKFNNLSGRIGNSRVKSVDIYFLKVEDPGIRINVGVNLDMAAQDFVMAWRACMLPESLYNILSPVSDVKGGRVNANVWVYWDKLSGHAAQALGDVHLDNCFFDWGKNKVGGLTGDATSPDFGSNVEVVLKGILNGLPIDICKISLQDPFGKQIYTYYVKMHTIPEVDVFHLDKSASIILEGRGRGPEIKGKVDITSKGFDLFGTYYRPVKGLVIGRGNIKGSLWPVFAINLKGAAIEVPHQKLILDARFTTSGGNVNIGGKLNLKTLQAYAKKRYWPLEGDVFGNIDIAWGESKEVSLKGNLICNNALIFYNDEATTLNGPLLMRDVMITSEEFHLKTSTTKLVISGSLDIREPLYLKGKLIIDGLKIGDSSTISSDILKDINGQGSLIVKNMDLYGISFDRATAKAELKDGVLKLDDMELSTVSGGMKGSVIVNIEGDSTFDIALSLKDADIKTLFQALYPGDAWIEGDMDLTGRLWGSMDSLNGDIVFLAQDGRIMKLRLISKIFTVLNVYKIIKSAEVDLLSKGFSYNFISSTFKIRDGILQFDDFYLDSNSIQFSAIGEYNLNTKIIDALVGVQPLETVDKTISLIPLIGWVLTANNGRFIVISLKVKGDIDDPSILPAPINTISKPVVNTILRTLKLPKKIITHPGILLPGGNRINNHTK
ncbi:MAG: AsmA-like C-terminal domain-containing protein [Deltaproteobacteria bacterium]|nr:AsmA-like C-terminal domain-containing protein [Deltaproteobacteria bacterium]